MTNVRFVKVHPDAQIPYRGSSSAAGYDLRAVEDYYVDSGEVVKVDTGLSIELPEGTFGGVFPRSGLSTKSGLRLANCVGVIDSDYRGSVLVPLYNDSPNSQSIKKGDRVAQLTIIPYIEAEFVETHSLSETARSSGGFSSTGIN